MSAKCPRSGPSCRARRWDSAAYVGDTAPQQPPTARSPVAGRRFMPVHAGSCRPLAPDPLAGCSTFSTYVKEIRPRQVLRQPPRIDAYWPRRLASNRSVI